MEIGDKTNVPAQFLNVPHNGAQLKINFLKSRDFYNKTYNQKRSNSKVLNFRAVTVFLEEVSTWSYLSSAIQDSRMIGLGANKANILMEFAFV